MATGLIQGSVTQYTSHFRSYIYWSYTQSQTGNYTDVTVEVLVDTDNTDYDWDGTVSGFNINIYNDDETYANFNSDSNSGYTYSSATSPTGRAAETFKTRTFRVNHATDGTLGSVALSSSFALPSGGFGPGDVSISDSINPPDIDRGLMRVKDSGTWKAGIPYVKDGGQWKQGIAYVKDSGSWKIGV